MEHMPLRNPQNFPYWRIHLEWLMTQYPDRVRTLLREDQAELMRLLDDVTVRADAKYDDLIEQGMPEFTARTIAMGLATPNDQLPEKTPESPLTVEEKQCVTRWLEHLPDRIVSLDGTQCRDAAEKR